MQFYRKKELMEHNRPTNHFLDKDDQLPSFSTIFHRYDINIYFKYPLKNYIFRLLKHYFNYPEE